MATRADQKLHLIITLYRFSHKMVEAHLWMWNEKQSI